jgi:DNA replication protein DnaD
MNTAQKYTPRKLSNVQTLLLQMFETNLSENDLKEVRNVLTRHFFKKAEQSADKHMKENGITLKDINKGIAELNENRTAYTQKMRGSKR